MKYYTATEALNTFPHIMPYDDVTLQRWIRDGKFPPHDTRVIRKGKPNKAWSEHTILNWKVIAKAAKVTICPPAYAEGSVTPQKVRPSKRGRQSD